ncbi:MAG TPA: cobalamin-dependent protein [Anaerolineae bacterium]|nr:cobalamin-dependent protein [Anaerolineae bacterium]
MKILFVYPFFLNESALEQQWMTLYPPLGLLYLAAGARRAGHGVAVFDGTFAEGDADFVGALDRHRPDVVCFASLITLRPIALRLASTARLRGAVTIAGGPDPTSYPEEYLLPLSLRERGPGGEIFSLVVTGEADETLLEVLDALQTDRPASSIAGTAFRPDSGEIARSASRPPISNLDSLPFPARDLIDVPRYLDAWKSAHGYSSLTIAASRGCPLGCDHCANSATGPHFRVRSIASVVREMVELETVYAPDRFRLVDEFEGLGRDWLVALGRAMIEAGVRTPFEGLKPSHLEDVPMLAEVKDICAERNAWLPPDSSDAHAMPNLDIDDLLRRWREGKLPEGERLAEP